MLTRFQEDQLLIQQLRAEVERLTRERDEYKRDAEMMSATQCDDPLPGEHGEMVCGHVEEAKRRLAKAEQRVEQLERIVTSYKTDREQELEEALAQAQQQINELQDAHRILQNEGQRLAEARLATAQADLSELQALHRDKYDRWKQAEAEAGRLRTGLVHIRDGRFHAWVKDELRDYINGLLKQEAQRGGGADLDRIANSDLY